MAKYFALSLFLALLGCAQSPSAPSKRHPPHRSTKTSSTPPEVTTLTAAPVDTKLLQKLRRKNIVVVDVRDSNDFVNGHLTGAKNINFLASDFEAQVGQLDRRRSYLLYCSSGSRAGKALLYFQAKGLKAENIGGYTDLKDRGAAVEGLGTPALP